MIDKLKSPLFLALAIAFIFLSLILSSGLYCDDKFNFYTYKFYSNFSVLILVEGILNGIKLWFNTGRFIPIAFILQHVIFALSKTVFLYKSFNLILHFFSILAFIKMLKQFCTPNYIAIWVIVYIAQIKFYIHTQDAFTTFNGMMALLAIFIFYAVIFYFKFLSTNKPLHLLLSLLMCVSAVLTYEIGFVSFIIILCIALNKQRLSFFTTKSNYIILSTLLIILISLLSIRAHAEITYSGLRPNYEFDAIVNTLGNQIVSTFPLANFISTHAVFFVLLEQFKDWYIILISIISLFFLILFIKQFNKQSESSKPINKDKATSWIVALLLIIVPAFFISISTGYQSAFGSFKPYIQVYFQNFGLSLIFTLIIGSVYNRYNSKKFLNGMMILFFLMGFASFLLNASRIQYYNRTQSNLVAYYFNSLEMGLLKQVKSGETVYVVADFLDSGSFLEDQIAKIYNKDIHVVNSSSYNKNMEIDYVYRFNRDSSQANLYKVDTVLSKEILVASLKFPLPKINQYTPRW